MSAWRTVALVSVALNLLVGGIAVGAYAVGARIAPPAAPADAGAKAERPLRALVAAAAPERREAVRREIVRTFANARDVRKDARDARISLLQTVQAEPYDAAAVRAAFARMRAADSALTARFHDLAAEQLGAMSPQERRQAVAMLLQRRGARDGPRAHLGVLRDRRGGEDQPPP